MELLKKERKSPTKHFFFFSFIVLPLLKKSQRLLTLSRKLTLFSRKSKKAYKTLTTIMNDTKVYKTLKMILIIKEKKKLANDLKKKSKITKISRTNQTLATE